MIKGDEVVNGLCKERVPFFCEDEVVGNTNRDGLWENDGIDQERVERSQAADVKVDIDTSIVV